MKRRFGNAPTLGSIALTAGFTLASACSVDRQGHEGTAGSNASGGAGGGAGKSATSGGHSAGGAGAAGSSNRGGANSGGANSGGEQGNQGGAGAGTGGSATTDAGETSVGGEAGSAGINSGGAANGGNNAGGSPSGAGGTTSKGGTTSAGGTTTGGTTAGAGGSTTPRGGTTGAGGTTGSGGSCSGGLSMCTSKCVDTSTDKANCGTCGTACEGYQFCASGKCLPTYQSTRVQPLTSGSSGVTTISGGVARDKAQGDLVLQLNGNATLSAPGATFTTTLDGLGFVRYAATGNLVWFRDSNLLFGGDSNFRADSTNPIALADNGDVVLSYSQYIPSGGPVAGKTDYLLARVGAYSGNLLRSGAYVHDAGSSGGRLSNIVPRSAKSDFIAYQQAYTFQTGGSVYRVADSGSAMTGSELVTSNFIFEAMAGADGQTLWYWGGVDGATQPSRLNPWSTQTWQWAGNPFQFSGGDVYIVGAKDDGTTIGPWFSEGDYGALMHMVVDSAGDLIVVASASGYVTFNGGQEFFPDSAGGLILAKISHTDGKILWRTPLAKASLPERLVLLPGDRVVTTDVVNSDGSYTLGIYSGANGSLLSRIPVNAKQTVQLVAAGKSDMFVVGAVSSALDFNPGTATDTQGATPGLFITRYSF